LHGQIDEAVLEQRRQCVDVAGHPGHDHARLLIGVEVERLPLKVGEDLHPQLIHQNLTEPPSVEDTGSSRRGIDGDGHHINGGHHQE